MQLSSITFSGDCDPELRDWVSSGDKTSPRSAQVRLAGAVLVVVPEVVCPQSYKLG